MSTILNLNGFRFIIWLNDHAPPHIHVFKGGGEAKIAIGDNAKSPWLMIVNGLTKQDARQALIITATHQHVFVTAWEKIHGHIDK